MNEMDELEVRLRWALGSAVAGAQVPFDPMGQVLRHAARRRAKLVAAAVVVVIAILAAIPISLHARADGRRSASDRKARLGAVFPGGGRLLLADGSSLKWLYPDGHSVQIASGFAGADAQGSHLLAWKIQGAGTSYYEMNLDGSASKLVLPAENHPEYLDQFPQLSPDGSRLAYVRDDRLPGGSSVATIWWVDLATGRRQMLGPVLQSRIVWKDNTDVLATAVDSKSVLSFNVNAESRSTYLTLSGQALANAYEKAHPTAGPLEFVQIDGFGPNTTSPNLALWVAAAGSNGSFTQPAEALISTGGIRIYAPPTPQQFDFSWGPHATFVIRTGVTHGLSSSHAYVGHVDSNQLSAPIGTSNVGPAALDPTGNFVALQDDEILRIAEVPPARCNNLGQCPAAQAEPITTGPTVVQGTIVTWQP